MTRAEVEAAAKAQQGEAKLLVLAVSLLLDIRDGLTALRKAVEARDTWTRATPEPRNKTQRKG